MNKSTLVAGATMLAALGVGGTLAGQAVADTPSPSPSASSSASTTQKQAHKQAQQQNQQGKDQQQGPEGKGRPGEGPGGRMGRPGMGADSDALAKRLGLDATEVKTAVQQVREANRPSDADREKMRSMTAAQRQAAREAQQAKERKALASKLGVSEAKLKEAMDALQSEHDAQEATEMKSTLDKAVKDGKLTRAEADAVTKAIKAGVIDGHGGRR